MKFLAVTLLALVAVASARHMHISLEDVIDLEKNFAYGYLNRVSIPLADKIRKAEEEGNRAPSRIIGGSLASLGQFPYQAGLLLQLPTGTGFASAVLVSPNRVLSAAHNFHDHVSSVTAVTVVLGSTTVFVGGIRFDLTPSDLFLHENYIPSPPINDIAMLYLPQNVVSSSIIAPIALPSGAQLDEDFAGDIGIASGFGKTADIGGVVPNQPLSYVDLPVISNEVCAQTFGGFVLPSNVCTSGEGGKNICSGDSGGPLAITRDDKPLLIGITSFGTSQCEGGHPSAYARVTFYMDWVNGHL
uniref:Serine protease 37 n=1 Tax=Mamestra configurata TaxID=174822 RepID=C9W8F8_9NEOP|nr:serine protease 37 [Mamestra configurata]